MAIEARIGDGGGEITTSRSVGIAMFLTLFSSWSQTVSPALLVGPLQAAGDLQSADKASYLQLARQGWSYQLRTTMLGRDLSIPVDINGKRLSGAYHLHRR